MSRFNHLMNCLLFADDEEEEDEMWDAYYCGLDPFVMTGNGIPYNEDDDDWGCSQSNWSSDPWDEDDDW